MNINLKSVFFGFIFSTLVSFISYCQSGQSGVDTLNLSDSGRKIENSISFNTDNVNYRKTTLGQKVNIKATSLVINGDTLIPERINTRGQSTLYFRRKSYSLSLRSHATFRYGQRTESFKKFFVLSLSMDKFYISNRLAFEMMEVAQMHDLFYTFCELRINGQSEGICMIIERPEDWAMKKKSSPLLIRRGYNNSIDKLTEGKSIRSDSTRMYREDFKEIYRSLNKHTGEESYNTLSKLMDIDSYLKWLAFNFFVRNGDYTDEAYFFIDPSTHKFSIIPWDYDDLFSVYPHEGSVEYKKNSGDKLFFSTEDQLDRKIINDPFLYKKYLVQFEALMNQLSPDVLKRDFENTYAELYPYYSNKEIISKSGFDLYKNVNLYDLKSDMLSLYRELLINRSIYLDYIGNQLRDTAGYLK